MKYLNLICLFLGLLLGLVISSGVGASTYTVNSILDNPDTTPGDNICASGGGPNTCTLRAAIMEANAHTGGDTINFSLGLIQISISNDNIPLPTITDTLTIDGTTAPSYNNSATSIGSAPPSVYIDGSSLTGTTADGFRVQEENPVFIRAIGITGFPDNGIEVIGGVVTTLDKNWIGVGRTGGLAGNGGSGVYLNDCDRCVVGQTIPLVAPNTPVGLGNLISNNAEDGVFVIGGDLNLIAGNWIGLNPDGSSGNGNLRHGVLLQGPNQRVGNIFVVAADDFVVTPNQIGYNKGDGVRAEVGNQTILGNAIFNNVGVGVFLQGTGSRLGSLSLNYPNVIYENGSHGVVINSSDNSVFENWIYENSSRGVQINSGTGSKVQNNSIFSNSSDAVRVDSNSNTISSNEIGRFLNSQPGNASTGVVLVGDDNTALGNDIINMAANGVLATGTGNAVTNNTIESSAQDGVLVSGGGNTLMGNTVILSGDDGIDFSAGNLNKAQVNKVGTSNGAPDQGNVGNGIRVRAGSTNTELFDNVIAYNADGIRLEGSGTKVCLNRIGLGPIDEPAGNDSEGVRVLGNGNSIGNASNACPGNSIGHNKSDGIQVEGQNNVISLNYIGGGPGVNYANVNGGILLTTGAANNLISDNSLWYNGNDGVRVGGLSLNGNRIEYNSMRFNGDLGIDLLDNGITANDANDADTGPNNLQNFPVILEITSPSQDILHVRYRIDTTAPNATLPLIADFYLTVQPGIAQGVEWVARDNYNVAPNAEKVAVIDISGSSLGTNYLIAMAIDSAGNSSEMTLPTIFSNPVGGAIFKDGFE